MSDPYGSATAGSCPDDVVDILRPGDHAPDIPAIESARCPVAWLGVQDLLGADVPWRCGREQGHPGRHIADSPRAAHGAAVLPHAM